jgi:hypothetical protein
MSETQSSSGAVDGGPKKNPGKAMGEENPLTEESEKYMAADGVG